MSTIQEAPREQEQVIGVVTGIVTKGPDKWQVVVQPDGSQYTKNLWTKDGQLVGTLATMIGARLAFLCNASHWNMQDGTPVRSLWIEAAGQPEVGSPALAGPQQHSVAASNLPQQQMLATQPQPVVVQPTVTPMATSVQAYDNDPKQGKIHRQTATKVAAILLTNLPAEERTMSTLLTLAERLVAYYDNGLPAAENLDQLMQRAMPQSMEGGDPGPVDPGYAGDDDIPF